MDLRKCKSTGDTHWQLPPVEGYGQYIPTGSIYISCQDAAQDRTVLSVRLCTTVAESAGAYASTLLKFDEEGRAVVCCFSMHGMHDKPWKPRRSVSKPSGG